MTFELAPVGLNAYLLLIAITLVAACIPLLWLRKEGVALAWKKSGIAALFVAPIMLGIVLMMSDNAFVLSGKNLLVRADYFYNYARSLDEFDLSRAQIGPYQSIPAAKLSWRRSGVSLPGINAGHFSTLDGQVIFVVLTDRSQVLYLPAKSGASLLVSVSNPNAVLGALKRAQSAS